MKCSISVTVQKACLLFLIYSILQTSNAQSSNFVMLTAGGLFTKITQNQLITVNSSYWKRLIANNNSLSSMYGGISVGKRTPLNSSIDFEVGLGFYHAADINQTGKVYQYDSPSFYNLNYKSDIRNQRLIAEGKLLKTIKKIYHPYVSIGGGVNRNRSTNYHEIPVNDFAVADPPFTNFTLESFAYSVGFGLDINVSTKCRLGMGYEYSNLGTASLGPPTSSTQNLSSGRLYASQFKAQISRTI